MFSILGLPDEGRDTLMSAALDPPDSALESWRQWERSGADARTDPVARRWLPLIGHNLRDAPVEPAVRALFVEARRDAWASNLAAAGRRAPRPRVPRGCRHPHDAAEGGCAGQPSLHTSPDSVPLATSTCSSSLSMPWRRRASSRSWAGSRCAGPRERDLLLAHGVNLRKPPHGALDLHRYLLAECCWAGADRGVWQRAQPMTSVTSTTVVPAAADLLLHVCVHGVRWSPVHAGHWVADAVRIIQTAGERLDWDVVVAEAARRRLGLQLSHALRLVRERGHVDVPQAVLDRLERQPASWRDRLECRVKGRPAASAGGLFMIWTAWRRTTAAARTDGGDRRRGRAFWPRRLESRPAALMGRFAGSRLDARASRLVRRAPPRGASTRTRITAQHQRPASLRRPRRTDVPLGLISAHRASSRSASSPAACGSRRRRPSRVDRRRS